MAPIEFEKYWLDTTSGPVLYDPNKSQIEDRAAAQNTLWVRITVWLPRENKNIHALAKMLFRKMDFFCFPDGIPHSGTQWGNRRDLAASTMEKEVGGAVGTTSNGPASPNTSRTVPQKASRIMFVIFAIIGACLAGILFSRLTGNKSPKDTKSQKVNLISLGGIAKPAAGKPFNPPETTPRTSFAGIANNNTDNTFRQPVTIIHGDLKVTLACAPSVKEILCAGFIENIGKRDEAFYLTGADYPKYGWARDTKGNYGRLILGNFELGEKDLWNNWHVSLPASTPKEPALTKFWFKYQSDNPDAATSTHINLDMIWHNDFQGFDIPNVPIVSPK